MYSIKQNKSRIFGLDFLRAAAIIFVVIGHGLHFLPQPVSIFLDFFILDGVSIFFVLSGFLIGGILIKDLEQTQFDLKDLIFFWKKRWYRTFPNYFLILLLLFLINLITYPDFKIQEHFKYFFFLQNFKSSHPKFFPEAWSLSIEEWFYVIIPLLLYLQIKILKLSNRKAVINAIIFVIISATSFRLYRYGINVIPKNNVMWEYSFRKQVITRLDSIMYGVLIAYINFFYQKKLIKIKNALFTVGLLLLISDKLYFLIYKDFTSLYSCVFSFMTLSIGSMLLIPYLSLYSIKNQFVEKTITHISLTSYSLYLTHFSLVHYFLVPIIIGNMTLSIVNDSYFTFFLYIFLSYIISSVLYQYYELPLIKLRDKILSRSKTAS